MPRSQIIVALTAVCFAVVATLGLLNYARSDSSRWTFDFQPQFLTKEDVPNDQQVLQTPNNDEYLLGVGKADITGPVAEINFMGYADPAQLGSGVRQRLYSRAFIVGDLVKHHERVVYLVLDTQSGDTAIRQGILDGVSALGPEYSIYGQQNIAVTGTHSHSGPGAWLNYLLPQVSSRGFNKASYEAIVSGGVESIRKAHESLAPGTLSFGNVRVEDANTNRSPYAYLANPSEERARYDDNVDKDLTLLKFRRSEDAKDIGILTWFPVHGTSMLGNNTLVTGDNKGVAAKLFEQYAAELTSSSSDFVAGFSQANVGDTSPNIEGAYCESGPDAGQQCNFETSLCGGKNGPCHGRGPHWGLDDAGTASTFEIGRRQYLGARSLFELMQTSTAASNSLRGTVRSLHVFVDFANRTFTLSNGSTARTCPAALGYSFAAGTTDGPGAFDFKQNNSGVGDANPFWASIRNQLHEPGPDQIDCHGAKPILLDVGETLKPYMWTPNIVDVQLLRIGALIVIVSPGEATTMAGRRWKEALASTALKELKDLEHNNADAVTPMVVLGGPANSYTHYIATPEEYDIQRYEGASTLYGKHTLDAYIGLTKEFLPYLSASSVTSKDASTPPSRDGLPGLSPGPQPPIHTNVSLSFISPVVYDGSPFFHKFGDVLEDVEATYTLSHEAVSTVSATFVGAHPRNDLRLGQTFAAVEHYDQPTGAWTTIRDDSDWSLVFEWRRTNSVTGTSAVKISWELGWEIGVWGRRDVSQSQSDDTYRSVEQLKGLYRLRYRGDSKSIGGKITAFEGVSGQFRIV